MLRSDSKIFLSVEICVALPEPITVGCLFYDVRGVTRKEALATDLTNMASKDV